jgi:hypothetical protein
MTATPDTRRSRSNRVQQRSEVLPKTRAACGDATADFHGRQLASVHHVESLSRRSPNFLRDPLHAQTKSSQSRLPNGALGSLLTNCLSIAILLFNQIRIENFAL